MSDDSTSVDALRRRIDEIDLQLHALIRERADVVAQLRPLKDGADKGAGSVIRPAREASIFRRLAAGHDGPMPLTAVIAIWRLMISGSLRVQAPLSLYGRGPDMRVLALGCYGLDVPFKDHQEDAALCAALESEPRALGFVPVPKPEDAPASAPWWALLSPDPARAPVLCVGTRMPFVARQPQAFLLARVTPEASGADRTLLRVTGDAEAASKAADSGARVLARWAGQALLDLPGFAVAAPGALAPFAPQWLGTYPVPGGAPDAALDEADAAR